MQIYVECQPYVTLVVTITKNTSTTIFTVAMSYAEDGIGLYVECYTYVHLGGLSFLRTTGIYVDLRRMSVLRIPGSNYT